MEELMTQVKKLQQELGLKPYIPNNKKQLNELKYLLKELKAQKQAKKFNSSLRKSKFETWSDFLKRLKLERTILLIKKLSKKLKILPDLTGNLNRTLKNLVEQVERSKPVKLIVSIDYFAFFPTNPPRGNNNYGDRVGNNPIALIYDTRLRNGWMDQMDNMLTSNPPRFRYVADPYTLYDRENPYEDIDRFTNVTELRPVRGTSAYYYIASRETHTFSIRTTSGRLLEAVEEAVINYLTDYYRGFHKYLFKCVSFGYQVAIDDNTDFMTTTVGNLVLQREQEEITIKDRCAYVALCCNEKLRKYNTTLQRKYNSTFGTEPKPIEVREIIKFIKDNNISCILYSAVGKIILNNVIDNKRRILLLEVSSNHIYTDQLNNNIRKSLLARAIPDNNDAIQTKLMNRKCNSCNYVGTDPNHKLIHDPRPVKHLNTLFSLSGSIIRQLTDNTIYYVNITQHDLPALYQHFNAKPSLIKMTGGNIMRLEYYERGITIMRPADLNIPLAQSLKMSPASSASLLSTQLNKHMSIFSTFNTTVKSFFDTVPTAHRVKFNTPTNLPRWEIDITKCYTSILASFNLPIYSKLDYIEPYKAPLQTGYYYCEGIANNHFCNETGWYPMEVVEYNNLKPTKQFIPSSVTDLDTVKNFLCSIPIDQIKEVNTLIGLWRVNAQVTSLGAGLTSNINESKLYNTMYELRDYEDTPTGLYFCHSESTKLKNHSGIALYCYIIQMSNLFVNIMYDEIIKQGGTPLYSFTDSITYESKEKIAVQSPYEIEINKTIIGKFKPPQTKNDIPRGFYTPRLSIKNNCIEPAKILPTRITYNKQPSVDDLIKQKSFMLSGFPGSGKTYLVREMLKKLSNVKILSFTNAACTQYEKAHTFHKEFYLSVNKQTSKASLLKSLQNVKTIIIDEYTMSPIVVFDYLIYIKENIKEINFIFVGDINQLKAINFSINEDNIIFQNLFNNTIIHLDYSYRCKSLAFLKHLLYDDISLSSLSKFGVKINQDSISDYSLCLLNSTVNNINNNSTANYYISNATQKGLIKNAHYIADTKPNSYKLDSKIYGKSTKIITLKESDMALFQYDHDLNKTVKTDDSLLSRGEAFTIHKAQGITIDGTISIHDFDEHLTNKYFSVDTVRRALYVACSRVKNPSDINIIISTSNNIYC